MNIENTKTYLTIDLLAERIGLPVDYIQGLEDNGKISFLNVNGVHYFFVSQVLEELKLMLVIKRKDNTSLVGYLYEYKNQP